MSKQLSDDTDESQKTVPESMPAISRRRFLLGAVAGGVLAIASRFVPPIPGIPGALSGDVAQAGHWNCTPAECICTTATSGWYCSTHRNVIRIHAMTWGSLISFKTTKWHFMNGIASLDNAGAAPIFA